MKHRLMAAMAGLTLLSLHTLASAQFLGTANTFAVLGGSTVTNTGPTVLWGDLGVSPGTAMTGFGPVDGGPGIVHGTIYPGGAVAQQAQSDLTTAYNTLAGESFNQNLSGQDLGGMTLFAGVYHFDAAAGLTGVLTLDAQGDPNARFDFQIGSALTAVSNSSVRIINGGGGCNVYWQVGSSATLGTDTAFAGHILAMDSITLTANATILDGSALARTGAVTLDTNTITTCMAPEPTSVLMMGAGLAALARRRARAQPI